MSGGAAAEWLNPLRDKRDKRMPRVAGPCAVVIFGVTGDLARKKLMPAIYDLANRGLLAPQFALVGFARRDWADEHFGEVVHDAVKEHSRTPFRQEVWDRLAEGIRFVHGDFDDEDAFTRLAETLHKRDALQRQIGSLVALNGAGLALLLALAGWWAIRQGLTPLTELSAELEHRDLHRLTPLEARLPRELVPLQLAFNRLFERLARAAGAQREFLADAAHQLRTPLTSLQTEIELAMLEPHDQRVDPLLQRLRHRVVRSARLAQQLLSLARAEDRSVDVEQRIDLRDIATETGQDWAHRALPSGVDLGFELVATEGTAAAFEAADIPVARQVAKLGDGAGGDTAVDLIEAGEVQMVVNSPRGRGPRADGGYIRAAAGVAGIPCLTTAAAALAAADGMADWSTHDLQVKPLQDFH